MDLPNASSLSFFSKKSPDEQRRGCAPPLESAQEFETSCFSDLLVILVGGKLPSSQ